MKRDEPGTDSERVITISSTTRSILADYIATNRHDVEDDHGREPLFTSKYGRPSTSTLRNRIYGITRPCVLSDECPHDRDIGACKAAGNLNYAWDCPSSESTHAIRRGTITWHLEQETPKHVVSDRASPLVAGVAL